MQQKDNYDLRIQQLETPQLMQNQTLGVNYNSANKECKNIINLKDQAAENLIQFRRSLISDNGVISIEDISKNKTPTQNTLQQCKNSQTKSSRKYSTSYSKDSQQAMYKILQLQHQNIPLQIEKVNNINSQASIPNNESNQVSSRSIKHVRETLLQKSSQTIINQSNIQIQNEQVQQSQLQNNPLKHQNTLQSSLLEKNQKQQIQRNKSLNLGSKTDEKNQQPVHINQKPYLQQSYSFKQKTIDNLAFIPQKVNFFDKYNQIQQQKDEKNVQDSKNSQEFQGLANEGFIKSSQQIQKPNSIKSITINANILNSTEMSKDFIENSTQQGNTLIINASKNKLFSESQEDQHIIFQSVPSSNKTIDSSYLIKYQNIANNSSQLQEVSQQLNQLQGESKEPTDNEQNLNQMNKSRQNLQKSQNSLNYSSNAHEQGNNILFNNKQKQKQSQHTQFSVQQSDNNKTNLNYFHSRQSSENLNSKKLGNFYITNLSYKSNLHSPKSTFNSQNSSRSKPFYHPFSHQNTSNYGEDQSLYNQLFISNISKYQPFQTFKHSASFKRSNNNSIKDNEDNFLNQHTNNQNIGNIKYQTTEKNNQSLQIHSRVNSDQAPQNQQSQSIEQEIALQHQLRNPDENKNEQDYQMKQKLQNQLSSIMGKRNNLSLLNLRGEDNKLESEQEIMYSQKRQNLSSLLTENLSEAKNINQKWSQIFRSYQDSKDYLFQSKKGIPKKRKNLLYEYKLVGLSTTPGLVTQTQQHSQNQFDKNNKSSFGKSKSNNQNKFIQLKEIPVKQQPQQLFLSIQQQNQQKQTGKSRFSISQKSKQKSLSPIKSSNIKNHFQAIQSERESQKRLLTNIEKDQTEYKQNIITNIQNQLNSSTISNSNKDIQNETQSNYMTFKERMKNQIYPSLETAQLLFDKKLISDDPDIADQKIRLIKYFLDENISIQEKRNNFKDIQMLFYPENKKYSEKICHEVLPFLNNMKNYFLKQDFYNPLYYLQNIFKNDQKLKQTKGYLNNRASMQLNIENSQNCVPQLSKYSQKNIQKLSEEFKNEFANSFKQIDKSQQV
ncbi:endo-1,4-beta-xylanase xylA, putative (macronuclear) [Tetrahymena thermophila SB210]|uniref:Endo-1,4-beta-xylanase xylA, putative n=1 Tax=Tetrahymena thermophila (strain SB210) TaxID=312017 RepID=I7M888_TETTS|nr:endo-1,4-beta-xylanase xylA, putative [Tetrahymena thermophila SB210]EAR97385.1 endo-1,4-beta-xylanase xylA, putative [Tetrahymena thermophila SB210]|eukprot:XP_001017630.1 endo-1,4-beta-xylanase xylA, putative [Tetrahymena thermophila SB210]